MLSKLMRNFRWQRMADRWGPRRLVVVEFGSDATRLVQVGRTGSQLVWEKALRLPKADESLRIPDIGLKDELHGFGAESQYVSAVILGEKGFVRLLSFPGQPSRAEALTTQVRQTLGAGDDFEVRHEMVRRADGQEKNPEYAVLAAALPAAQVDAFGTLVGEAGLTPVSLIPSGVAAANLAENTPGVLEVGRATGFLQIGPVNSMLLLYDGPNLALARQFKLGINTIIESLMSSFELDFETAAKLFNSGSFDFSANISPAVNSWMHQISISLDFIERRYSHRVEVLYLYGTGAGTAVLRGVFAGAVRHTVESWNVLAALDDIEPPSGLEEQPEAYATALIEGKRIMSQGLQHGA